MTDLFLVIFASRPNSCLCVVPSTALTMQTIVTEEDLVGLQKELAGRKMNTGVAALQGCNSYK